MAELEIRLFGELRLVRDGGAIALPASRKTRALFAYLLLAGKPVRREPLCELFWEVPDDPRGALRWSLSKIRKMLGPDAGWLAADRERVELKAPDEAVDLFAVRAGRARRPDGEILLEGLDLPNNGAFSLWLAAERRAAEPKPDEALDGAVVQVPVSDFQQTVHYTFTPDGVRIAYACTGEGPPIVKAATWLSHLDLDFESPLWGRLFRELSRDHKLVRYDERGNGLSEWNIGDLSFEAFVSDLEVVTDALHLTRFPLLGISQGGAVSIEYAWRHPERVSHLILIGAYAAGWRHLGDKALAEQRAAAITLVRYGWGQNNPAYRQIFSHSFMPSATAAEIDWFNQFQRRTTSAENAARFLECFADINVRARLAEIRVPTLVLHSREDQRISVNHGIELASTIPGAALVTLDSDSHTPLGREPAFGVMMGHIRRFLRD